jgi:protoheme IX farnesyltransferase
VNTTTQRAQTVTLSFPSVRDLVALTKPNITLMSVLVALGCLALAPGSLGFTRSCFVLLGVALSVMGAGALNMYLERDLDAKMTRTKDRPLPAGRVDPFWAALVGLVLGSVSIPVMFFAANGPLAAALTVFALISYVALYTPMKQKSPWALVVGEVPGAMPTLMGYVAVTGGFDVQALTLFAVLFFWQLPHFLAIGVYRDAEYARAGHKLFNHGRSTDAAKTMIVGTAVPLVAAGIMLWPLGVGSVVYGALSVVLGLWFLALTVRGYSLENANRWARRVFLGTLVYQTVLFGGLALDVGMRALFF